MKYYTITIIAKKVSHEFTSFADAASKFAKICDNLNIAHTTIEVGENRIAGGVGHDYLVELSVHDTIHA